MSWDSLKQLLREHVGLLASAAAATFVAPAAMVRVRLRPEHGTGGAQRARLGKRNLWLAPTCAAATAADRPVLACLAEEGARDIPTENCDRNIDNYRSPFRGPGLAQCGGSEYPLNDNAGHHNRPSTFANKTER
jgi:hypothetical protein